jgi:hypothetical protein
VGYAGPPNLGGFGFGPRRRGLATDWRLYSASRRMISSWGTARTLRTSASKVGHVPGSLADFVRGFMTLRIPQPLLLDIDRQGFIGDDGNLAGKMPDADLSVGRIPYPRYGVGAH